MLFPGERNFASAALLNQMAATGADLLVRRKSGRNLPSVGPLPRRLDTGPDRCADRSRYDAEISIRTVQGTRTGHYRLLTTLTAPSTHPAAELVRTSHERGETGTAPPTRS